MEGDTFSKKGFVIAEFITFHRAHYYFTLWSTSPGVQGGLASRRSNIKREKKLAMSATRQAQSHDSRSYCGSLPGDQTPSGDLLFTPVVTTSASAPSVRRTLCRG